MVGTYFTVTSMSATTARLAEIPAGRRGRDLFGVWSEDFDGLEPAARQSLVWNGKRYPVMDYAEILHPEGSAVEAVYGEDFYAGTPAVTFRKLGQGRAVYIGARTGMDFLNDFYGALIKKIGIDPVLPGYRAVSGLRAASQ